MPLPAPASPARDHYLKAIGLFIAQHPGADDVCVRWHRLAMSVTRAAPDRTAHTVFLTELEEWVARHLPPKPAEADQTAPAEPQSNLRLLA